MCNFICSFKNKYKLLKDLFNLLSFSSKSSAKLFGHALLSLIFVTKENLMSSPLWALSKRLLVFCQTTVTSWPSMLVQPALA